MGHQIHNMVPLSTDSNCYVSHCSVIIINGDQDIGIEKQQFFSNGPEALEQAVK